MKAYIVLEYSGKNKQICTVDRLYSSKELAEGRVDKLLSLGERHSAGKKVEYFIISKGIRTRSDQTLLLFDIKLNAIRKLCNLTTNKRVFNK